MLFLTLLGIFSTANAAMLAGGWSTLTNKTVENMMLTFATTEMTANSNNDYSGCTVTTAEQQVVAGMNYKLHMNCPNGEQCTAVIYDVVWLNQRTLSSSHCNQAVVATHAPQICAGCVEKGCPDSQTLMLAMPLILQRIDAMSNSMYKVMPVSQTVTNCHQQVIAGMRYTFDVTVHDSSCMKSASGSTLSECPITDHMMSDMKFHAEIISQPWMHKVPTIADVQLVIKKKKPSHKLGGDGHDLKFHGKGHKLLGGDKHDLIYHGPHHKKKHMLGRDGHDYIGHGKNHILGGDGHDMVSHGKKHILGGDGHDMVSHGKKHLLGGDGHDMVSHGKKHILGGDGHDMVSHGKKHLLGGDGHDMVSHGKKHLLGGDGHDMVSHGKKHLLGGDGHDMVSHGKKLLLGGDRHDMVSHGKKHILGGDGHDQAKHGKGKDAKIARLYKEFDTFQKKYGKKYESTREMKKRFNIFRQNMKLVKKLQATEKGTAIYGATQFADLTAKEFQKYVGKKWDVNAQSFVEMEKAHIPKSTAPEAFDWRDHNAVTPVKNQGSCGSCWAFSTTGNIEGQWAIKKGKLISLSEQELVDCDKIDEGCNGGLPSNAYKEIRRLGGLETESEYKYDGRDEKCAFKKADVRAYINGSVSVSSDEKEMATWLAKNGPISIGINAFAMQFYFGGISHPWKIFCNPSSLDHGVLIVGYGVEGSTPYWIIKNSWGESWGEKGYYRAYRGSGVCGLNRMCTSSVVG